MPRLVPIEELNRLDPEAFAAALRPLFEAAEPLAAALSAARPFPAYHALLDQAEQIVATLPPAQQVEVVNAHPRIGDNPAAVRAASSVSYQEQGYDREAGADPGELARVYATLDELNQAYERRFGFRFVVFVNRRPKAALIPVIQQRLASSREVELATALHEMLLIARDRLNLLQQASP